MGIRVAIQHKTTYRYDRLVSLSPHVFRLRPAVHSRTSIQAYSFQVIPREHFIHWQQDPFGNYQARVVFPEKTRELSVSVEVIADLVTINPFDFFLEDYAQKCPFIYEDQLLRELSPYLQIRESGPRLNQWLARVDRQASLATVDFLVLVNQRLHTDIQYNIRMEPGVQSCEDSLEKGRGSCRDSAWLLVQILRHLGLAARFVSGYLVQLAADEKSLDGPSGPEMDFTDLHAWTEVFIPGAGWIGLDPTSGLFAGEGHIPLACTPDYASAAPVVGSTDPCEVQFFFENRVSRLREDPRESKPFSPDQWARLDALGYQVDRDLERMDVRMTMGGEPTFVSIDDMESPQWNAAADGTEKRALAYDLIFQLREQFGKQGMLHFGEGKWYPGEPLPRWQYGLYWRKDGCPIWKDRSLIASENSKANPGPKEARRFLQELAAFLALPSEHIHPAYEDAFYFLWAEAKIPLHLDPRSENLDDSLERRKLAQLLDRGLSPPAGYVLPIQWNYWNNRWLSCPWEFRRDQLFLVPGNSPIGLRLPLDSLPPASIPSIETKEEQSLFQELPLLSDYHALAKLRYGQLFPLEISVGRLRESLSILPEYGKGNQAPLEWPQEDESGKTPIPEVSGIRTAICVEVRNGVLNVFLPPQHLLEHYLDLVASVELTAEKLAMPVRIEGYDPPRDFRIERLVVSPDPGVIEVNIQPSGSWPELKRVVDTLYDQAHISRLGTEKFMLDGRHTGTGGGNHLTIGGPTPADSPLLRRPDLLRSLITYWQQHPGLSYLFSSAFIGPTSQAPRIDEGRDERLYEMELAFEQVPEKGFIPFWLVDRIFRHLLTDLTGNTHRSEFCIDKLYSPDTSSGRLGILEFRAFDMPPHRQMSLLQMLLVRGLVAWFWKIPYRHKLVRWGSSLHDKFLLPYYVAQDIREVVSDLQGAGYGFESDWFLPFLEFRFPRYGGIKIRDMELEIRMAIEPWHVLGEEVSRTGTARFVDSSLERVQVKWSGVNGSRYVLLCNGARVPMRETEIQGELVSGVRYRAWQPPSALHPTIGIDSPLVFDIVDTWNSRSIGGCTYHVSHPGGRHYDTFPVNQYEAEARRVSRFWAHGHTQEVMRPRNWPAVQERSVTFDRVPYPVDIPAAEINPDYPCTLDLRHKKKKS
jgi:uncharacterized protein (DUF2126 family)/transglutaminase-like putative cysteine protease